MASGPNIGAVRGYNVVSDPLRFTNYPLKRYKPNAQLELLIFDSQSNSSGSTVYSNAISINPAEGFSVHVDPNTTGNVIIETTINPDVGFWNTVGTITNGGYLNNDEKLSFLRIGLADGVADATVWLYRQYSSY